MIVHNEYVMDEWFGQANYNGKYPCCELAKKILIEKSMVSGGRETTRR